MKLATIAVTACALAGRVHADPPAAAQPTVLVAAGFGAVAVTYGTEWLVEGAVLPAAGSPVRVHALFARGRAGGEDFGPAPFLTARAGVERNACYPSGSFCAVFDADVGLLHANAQDFGSTGGMDVGDHDRDGFLLAGRAGFDAGNPHVRLRVVLDVAHAVNGAFHVHDAMGGDRDLSTQIGIEGEMVVGF